MCRDIQNNPSLLIVSDTAAIQNADGTIAAFEPVVREIEHFAPLFCSITWIACKVSSSEESRTFRAPVGVDIHYVLLPAVGGPGLKNRIKIISRYFWLFFYLPTYIRRSDVVHSRGPSHPAIVCAFYSFLFKGKRFWHKYAGNWVQKHPPFTYGLLRWLLNRATNTVVTINGNWPDQKNHQMTFENPCLTEQERIDGHLAINNKTFIGKLDILFVGRLEDAKGAQFILEFLDVINGDESIGTVRFVGDGPKRDEYEKYARSHCTHKIEFLGYLPKNEINVLYATSHLFFLPSAGEGFPKVVAEAANYGCIPVVSDVSCMSQYIETGQNGFILQSTEPLKIAETWAGIVSNRDNLHEIAEKAHDMAALFTYQRYVHRIQKEILNETDN